MELSPNVNCFVGKNGMGKTNLLDAIHYLSFGKSSFTTPDSVHLRHEAPFFLLQGQYRAEDGEEVRVACGYKPGGRKQLKWNDKDCRRIADDTGLEVEALGGGPGVHTARYAYPDRHDPEANTRKSLI